MTEAGGRQKPRVSFSPRLKRTRWGQGPTQRSGLERAAKLLLPPSLRQAQRRPLPRFPSASSRGSLRYALLAFTSTLEPRFPLPPPHTHTLGRSLCSATQRRQSRTKVPPATLPGLAPGALETLLNGLPAPVLLRNGHEVVAAARGSVRRAGRRFGRNSLPK